MSEGYCFESMFCDVCNSKEATVFLTQIVNGKMQKVNLCDACSKEKGVTDPAGFGLVDLLSNLGMEKEVPKSSGGKQCEVCGFTQADFKKTGRLGCSACYEVFDEQIMALIKTVHKGTKHTGKVPKRQHKAILVKSLLKTLQCDLNKAIEDEKFEKAAGIRDEIREIEKEFQS